MEMSFRSYPSRSSRLFSIMNPNDSSDDATSHLIDLTIYDSHGLCSKYTLRRHKYESEANGGCYEARSGWIKYIGPIEQFGGRNPVNSNLSSRVLPLCKPEHLRLVAYILECKDPHVVRFRD